MIKIVEFKPEHLEMMDMREHEAGLVFDTDIFLGSEVKQTAMDGDKVLCCWGILECGGIWQVPSKWIAGNGMFYARRAIKVIKEMIKDKPYVWSLCLNDELHDRWMRFIGLRSNPDTVCEMQGKEYIMYERVLNGS